MMWYASLVAVISVFSVLQLVHMHGSSSGTEVINYSWTRSLNGSRTIQQRGASIASGPRVFINTLVYRFYQNTLRPSRTIIDFSGSDGVVAVNVGRDCYLVDLYDSLNFTQMVDELTSRNGNRVTDDLDTVFVDATADGAQLNSTEVSSLFASNPSLQKICKSNYYSKIYQTSASLQNSPGECEKAITTVTFNTFLNLLVPVTNGYGCPSHR